MASRRRTVPGRMDQIESICELVDQAAQASGFDDKTNYSCQLAVTEACENIVRYAYGPDHEGSIEICIECEPGEITIELRDTGPPFDPSIKPPQDDPAGKGQRIGGLGLRLIHRIMDMVQYKRLSDRNLLRLTKKSPPPKS